MTCLRYKLGHTHQVVGGGREGEGSSDTVATAELRPVLPGDRLNPAERLLDTRADGQADGVATGPSRASVNRRTPPAGVLRYVLRYLQRARFVEKSLAS